jgi:hypothetical protein
LKPITVFTVVMNLKLNFLVLILTSSIPLNLFIDVIPSLYTSHVLFIYLFIFIYFFFLSSLIPFDLMFTGEFTMCVLDHDIILAKKFIYIFFLISCFINFFLCLEKITTANKLFLTTSRNKEKLVSVYYQTHLWNQNPLGGWFIMRW